MSGIQIEEGKIYLRDSRNGTIHNWEHLLSQMSYMVKFVGGKKGEEIPNDLRPQPPMAHLSPVDRAAEFDKRARMTNEQREQYDAEQEAAREKQAVVDEIPVGPKKNRYAFTAKTNGAKMDALLKAGWTVPAMLKEGLLVPLTDENTPADVESDL